MTSKERKYGQNISSQIYFIKKLDFLGINKKYTGYFMLVDILDVMINQGIRVVSFSKDLYPIIAKIYHKKETTIERNIRNLVDKCWNKDLMNKLKVSMLDGEKPVCRDFIFMIKDFMLDQIC